MKAKPDRKAIALWKALDDAAYALFQAKRLVDAGPITQKHVREAHAKACKVLNRYAGK